MKKGLKYTLVSLGSLGALAGVGLGIMYVVSPYKVKQWLGIASSYSDVFVDRLKGQPYTRGGYDGIDVSKHNGIIKWKEIAKNKRIKFVYIRATHGKGYVDRHYRRNIRLARKYGLKVGSYHLMSAGSSVTAQFRDFQKMVKKGEQDLIPVLDVEEILEYCNRYLPEDIAVVEVSEAAPRFHSRLNATGKRYRYRIINSQIPDVFWRRYATEEPEELDLDAMRKAAERLLGEHDFKAFTSAKKSKKSTVRRIDEIRIERIENRVEFVFTGNGFLHHMIRILMGTLLEVGKGIRTPESVTDVLESGDRAKAGALVPAKGLVLEEVFYA